MKRLVIFLFVVYFCPALAQTDSVDVTFMYFPGGNPTFVHLPGEFNNWANNSGGVINPGPRWTMTKLPDGSWTKTLRLKVGGGSGPEGSYEYKFNEDGKSSGWFPDPLNPYTFGSYVNSIIHVRKPTVFQIRPPEGSIVSSDTLRIVAGVFPSTLGSIDTDASKVLLDGVEVSTFGADYDGATATLSVAVSGLADGDYTLTVLGVDDLGSSSSDSVHISIEAGDLRWLTRDNPAVYEADMRLDGLIASASITDVIILWNTIDTLFPLAQRGSFSAPVTLHEGENVFEALGQLDGSTVSAGTIALTYLADHNPHPVIQLGGAGGNVSLNAFASTDPDGDDLSFHWLSEDDRNPEALGIDQEAPMISFPRPSAAGEYYFTLTATDPALNEGMVRNYMIVNNESPVPTLAGLNENPRWVKDAIVYEIFVPAFSPSRDLKGITAKLDYISQLGVNTIWLMPIMDNPGGINTMNAGYNIIDFFNVDESIGTLDDFRDLVDASHSAGIRVILDMTPNHSSGNHPWVDDIRRWGDYSIYRGHIENRILGDDRGLGQSVEMESGYPLYARYSNWKLANLNLSTKATRIDMMKVYRFWLEEMNADGFRLDVYWGPQNRYGEKVWWRPFREELKRFKPDAMLLGETDGTGMGSEINYADGGGGLDSGYDWPWYGQIKSTLGNGDVDNLHTKTINYSPTEFYNHYTGTNASYFRFLENHDEERIADIFKSNINRTKPGAVVSLTAPGIPMIYAGQEVGWTGRRNDIDFTNPNTPILLPYYRKLANIRKNNPALSSPRLIRVDNSSTGVYSYLRPHPRSNTVVAASFYSREQTVTLSMDENDFDLDEPLENGMTYYMNDLLIDSTYAVTKEDLEHFSFDVMPFQSRVFVFSDSAFFPLVTGIDDDIAAAGEFGFELSPNYPNPFSLGGESTVNFTVPGHAGQNVELAVYDILGRQVITLVDGFLGSGRHAATIRGSDLPAAGMYTIVFRGSGLGSGTPNFRALLITAVR